MYYSLYFLIPLRFTIEAIYVGYYNQCFSNDRYLWNFFYRCFRNAGQCTTYFTVVRETNISIYSYLQSQPCSVEYVGSPTSPTILDDDVHLLEGWSQDTARDNHNDHDTLSHPFSSRRTEVQFIYAPLPVVSDHEGLRCIVLFGHCWLHRGLCLQQ